MPMTFSRFEPFGLIKALPAVCLLVLWCAPSYGQTEPVLLPPFNQIEFEPAKRDKALVATQEYQAKEQELKDDTALSNSDRQKLRTANYHSYLKKMEGLLSKDQRKKAVTMLVENDVKGLRQKPALPRFYDQLNLTEKQAAKAKELNLQQRIKTQTVYHTGNYSPQERAEENKYISQEFTNKFNDLLTPEQSAKLAELRKQAAVVAAIPVPPLYQKLDLSGTQTDKLKQLLFERQRKLEALNKDPSLSSEARMQQVSSINGEANKNAEAILTKDQKVKIEDLLNEANYQMPPLYAQLELTTNQQAELKEALLWQAHETAVLKQETKLTADQRQQRLLKINAGMQERFNVFLTPEQLTRLNAILREMQKSQLQKPPERF